MDQAMIFPAGAQIGLDYRGVPSRKLRTSLNLARRRVKNQGPASLCRLIGGWEVQRGSFEGGEGRVSELRGEHAVDCRAMSAKCSRQERGWVTRRPQKCKDLERGP